MFPSRTIRLAALAALLSPAALRAQGSLSTLGFGYPNGQLSSRALGAGGAVGEMDPLSATNPAVLAGLGGSILYFQIEPEYRRLNVGNASESATIARYPLITAAFPITRSITIGLTASNLLDRSFDTHERGIAVAGDTALGTSNEFRSDGAIGDLRLALAWAPYRWIKLGVAAHAITGDNRIRNTETFDDSVTFAPLIDTATVGYTGNAYSAGMELNVYDQLSLAGSYRRGGPLSLKRGDTTIATANVPDRLAMSVAYIGIRGSAFAFRTAKDSWSRMEGLGSSGLTITDSWDTSVGADVLGPHVGQNPVQLRAGYRWRTLPFGIASTGPISEKTLNFGVGTTMGRGGRAALDIATFRSERSAISNLSETAWTLSVGLTVRP